ncbi:MAG: L,D-transpeptidase [Syntrophaceae bacterium]|nr:L,D-transpeptidase [Syntrophaceae bacterium]
MKKQNMLRYGSKPLFFLFILIFLMAVNSGPILGSETVQETPPFVPDALVDLSVAHAIVVDKTLQKLFVYRADGDSLQRIYEAPCSTGKNRGTKIESGDARTPEGIYFPVKFFSDQELSAIYGPMAFDLNYPNILDRKEGKNGNNIWLHGTDKPLAPFQSNGCIALDNNDIDAVSRFVTLNETPVIIQDYIKWVDPSVRKAQREDIIPIINEWASAMGNGDVRKLDGLHGKNAQYDSSEMKKLAGQVQRLKQYGGEASFTPKVLSLLKHDKYTVAMFRQEFTVNGLPYEAGSRKLFLKKMHNSWHIEGDVTEHERERQFIAALEKVNSDYANNDDIRRFLDSWMASWKAGNLKDYASFYASDFRAQRMNRAAWLAYKKKVFRASENVRIDIKNLAITNQSRGRAVATFEQYYSSSLVTDVGTKTLSLKKVDNSWKICKEVWKAKK